MLKISVEEKIRNYLQLNFKNRCIICNKEMKSNENDDHIVYIDGSHVELSNLCSKCVNFHLTGKLRKIVKRAQILIIAKCCLVILLLFMYAWIILRDIQPTMTWHWILRSGFIFLIAVVLFFFSVKLSADAFIFNRTKRNHAFFQKDPHLSCPNCHDELKNIISKKDGVVINFEKDWRYENAGYSYHCPKCNTLITELKDPIGKFDILQHLVLAFTPILLVFANFIGD